jgi:glycosyltransferase involved in cell wall biosynthesis
MPRLLVPLLTLKPNSASGVAFARNIVPALTRALGTDEVLVLGTPFIGELLTPLGCRVEVRRVAHARPARLWATRRLVPEAARRHRAGALFVPDGQLVPAPGLPPTVVALHHHLNYSRPQGQALGQRLYWKLWYDRALRRSCAEAAALLAPSAAFAREFEGFVPQAAGKLRVVPHGAGPAFSPEGPTRRFEQPHVLVVGNPSPYKNVPGAIRAFLGGAGDLPHLLAVAGLDEAELDEAAREAGAGSGERARLRALGRLRQDELAPLYRGADALLFPSRVESFGLPVVEAMAAGCPVVCSDLDSLIELGAEAVASAPPEDAEALGRQLRSLLTNRDRAGRLRAAGLGRARDLSWDAAAASVAAVLTELAVLEPSA